MGGTPGSNFAALSDESLEAMGRLFVLTEQQGGLPGVMAEFIVRLIPKLTGGRRPVAPFKAIVKLWYKVRQPLLKEWMRSSVGEAAINLNAGMHIGDAVYRDMMRALVAEEEGKVTLEINMDGDKFFDRIKHHILQRQARAVGYPIVLLRVSLAVCGADT